MRPWAITVVMMVVTVFACVLAQAGDEPSAVPTTVSATTTTTAPTTTASAPAGFVVSPGVVRAGKDLPWSATQPTQVVPRGLGVNIHFHDPKPGELEMMAAAGVSIVRMDVTWRWTEKVKGQYDFSAHERLLDALEKHNIRWMAILCYGNPLYDNWNGPRDEATRTAFVEWAKAFVLHFKGRGVLWEMWNEPNIVEFWKPTPNVDDYIQLALAVGKMMREVAPNEAYIGPATSRIDLPFIESCFKAGLLEYWDAVTVHPYRRNEPESVVEEYIQLGALIARHKPESKYVPIISGEWGYSTGWEGISREVQAKYLARQWLTNLACDIPISIWYEWRDEGVDPKDHQHNYGMVRHEHRADQSPVFEPHPAYTAMKTLTEQLDGYTFDKQLGGGYGNDWVLFFRGGEKGEKIKIVAWTTTPGGERIENAAGHSRFHAWKLSELYTYMGEPVASGHLRLTNEPQYITPEMTDESNADIRFFAAWPRLPWVMYTKGLGRYEVPKFPQAVNWAIRDLSGGGSHWPASSGQQPFFRFTRRPQNQWISATDGTSRLWGSQWVRQIPVDPITGMALPVVDDRKVKLLLQNPSGMPFAGQVELAQGSGPGYDDLQPVEFADGQTQATVVFTLSKALANDYRLRFRLMDVEENDAGFSMMQSYARIRTSHDTTDALSAAWQTHTEGDAAVKRTFAIAPADAPEGLGEDVRTIKITYDYTAGWTFGKVMPRTDELKKLSANPADPAKLPERLEMWVHGDGSGNRVRVRIKDSQGQTFQSELGMLDFTGWRFLSARLDKPDAGHWGGPNDGILRGPLELDTLILICKPDNAKTTKGEIHIALPQVVSSQ